MGITSSLSVKRGSPVSGLECSLIYLYQKGLYFIQYSNGFDDGPKPFFFIALFLFIFLFKILLLRKKQQQKDPEQVYTYKQTRDTDSDHSPPPSPRTYFRQASQDSPQAQL